MISVLSHTRALVTSPAHCITLIFLFNAASLGLTFRYSYNNNQSPFDPWTFNTPQNYQFVVSADKFPDNNMQGIPQTAPNILNANNGANNPDLQNTPTFQKNVYFTYRPMPPPPRRRRLFPYFILGFATGSAAILGGAAAANVFRG